MKGSITFRFGGDSNNYRVHITRQGTLDSADLEAVAVLLSEDIMLQKTIETGEIIPTVSDPTGRGQLHDTWSN